MAGIIQGARERAAVALGQWEVRKAEAAAATVRFEGFYVTVQSGTRTGFLLGPFVTRDEAEGRVEDVREFVVQRMPAAHFYGFGVSKVTSARDLPNGRFNGDFGLSPR